MVAAGTATLAGKQKNHTVAVIGGSGFIGREIVAQLASAGFRIKVLTRNADRCKYLKPMGAVGQITLISGNASDRVVLEKMLQGCHAVVNTVGILAEQGSQRFDALQAELPQVLGEISAAAGVSRLVHLSAIGADQHSPSRYARTKGLGEAGLHKAFPDAVILRPSLVFGQGDGFFNRFASMAMLAPALPLIGGGRNLVQPVFVGDVADAVLAALSRDDAKGRIYELGGPAVLSFRQVMAYIIKEIRRPRALLPIPFAAMGLAARLMQFLPAAPITPDQLKLLRVDNVVGADAAGLADLGITPTSMELVVPKYLARYRPDRQRH